MDPGIQLHGGGIEGRVTHVKQLHQEVRQAFALASVAGLHRDPTLDSSTVELYSGVHLRVASVGKGGDAAPTA
eukprot:6826427-Pyramimonas_sp.AAC.1